MAAPPQSLLLVDGYNIIGAWSCLKKTRDRNGLESARFELTERLINYSARRGHKTQLVFDAHYQNTPSHQEIYTNALSVYYTAWAQTADTYIEKVCASLGRSSPSRFIVATSDHAQRLTVVGYGAYWMSAQQLKSDVELAERQSRRQYRPQKPSRRRFLSHALDANAQQRLEQWRQGNSIKSIDNNNKSS